jgi:hypothetical protein
MIVIYIRVHHRTTAFMLSFFFIFCKVNAQILCQNFAVQRLYYYNALLVSTLICLYIFLFTINTHMHFVDETTCY